MNNFEHENGTFYFNYEGKRVGELHYTMAGENKMIIDHTEVDESMEGKGIGKLLLEDVIDYVREKNIKVIPRCTFASASFRKHPEWQDVLYK